MFRERSSKRYVEAIGLYQDIKDWCKEQKITNFDVMMERLPKERPELYARLETFITGEERLRLWFMKIEYHHERDALRKENREKFRGQVKHDRRPVPCICVENGKRFRSFAEAGRWLHVDGTLISDCCYEVRNMVRGFHFELAGTKEDK